MRPKTASILFPEVIAWCAYVTVVPEHNKIRVFNKGTSIGLKTSIPFGGHIEPISIIGASAAAKKDQKNADILNYLGYSLRKTGNFEKF